MPCFEGKDLQERKLVVEKVSHSVCNAFFGDGDIEGPEGSARLQKEGKINNFYYQYHVDKLLLSILNIDCFNTY
tara:strand:- start:1349 stop:1570 length:222 start_codon:yes stop_codon:yes gene_type:complete